MSDKLSAHNDYNSRKLDSDYHHMISFELNSDDDDVTLITKGLSASDVTDSYFRFMLAAGFSRQSILASMDELISQEDSDGSY